MTIKKHKNTKNLLIVVAMLVVLVIGTIGAYFTATDEVTNNFTVGNISVELNEPSWEALDDLNENGIPDVAEDVLPNTLIEKDPTVTNLSDSSDAFVFLKVTVPKASVLTSDVASGNKNAEAAVTQLFQMNDSSNTTAGRGVAWNGKDTYNSTSWYLVSSTTTGVDANEYIYVYGKSNACTALPAGETTAAPLFNSVTFCNAVEGQGLEDKDLEIKIDAYAIQTKDLTADDVVAPADVWSILNAQTKTAA